MSKIDDVLLERGRLVDQMRALSAANPEGFDSETQEKYDRLNEAQERCKATADRLHNEESLIAELDAPVRNATRAPVSKPAELDADQKKAAFENYLRKGKVSNALEVGTVGEGGYLTHDDFDMTLRMIRDDYSPLRGYFNVITTTGDHNIRVEAGTGSASWIDEEASYTESAPSFTNVTLNAYKLTQLVKVSEELLQDSDFDISSYLAERFGKNFALAEEEAFITGNGTLKPTGLISGAGSVTRTESPLATTVTKATLLDVYYGLQRQYRSNGTWLFSDATVRDIRGIVDNDDQFIWQPGLQAGQPDRVLGRPYVVSAYMPDAGESPLSSPVIFGDLTNYTVADRTGFRVQRLDELYAETGQVGFRAWARLDGKTIQAAGIKKVAAF